MGLNRCLPALPFPPHILPLSHQSYSPTMQWGNRDSETVLPTKGHVSRMYICVCRLNIFPSFFKKKKSYFPPDFILGFRDSRFYWVFYNTGTRVLDFENLQFWGGNYCRRLSVLLGIVSEGAFLRCAKNTRFL